MSGGGGGDNGGGIIACESASLFAGPLLSSVGECALVVILYSGVLFESFLSFPSFVPVGCRGCGCCWFEGNVDEIDDDGGGGMYISMPTLCSLSSSSKSFKQRGGACCDSVCLWCLRLLVVVLLVLLLLAVMVLALDTSLLWWQWRLIFVKIPPIAELEPFSFS